MQAGNSNCGLSQEIMRNVEILKQCKKNDMQLVHNKILCVSVCVYTLA